MTSFQISKELNLIKELDGNTYKTYRFLKLKTGDSDYVYGITREQIQEDCQLGYTKVYQILKELQERNLIEYNGAKKFIRILPLD